MSDGTFRFTSIRRAECFRIHRRGASPHFWCGISGPRSEVRYVETPTRIASAGFFFPATRAAAAWRKWMEPLHAYPASDGSTSEPDTASCAMRKNRQPPPSTLWRIKLFRSPARSIQLAEIGADVLGEQLRFFHRRKMASSRHHSPSLDVVNSLRPMTRRTNQLARKHRHRSWGLDASAGLEAPRMMARFIVKARRRIYRLRDPVDHHIGQQLIFGKTLFDLAMTIAPGAKLLDDPRAQSRRRIIESVCERLRLGSLDPLIAGFRVTEFFDVAEKNFFLRRQVGSRASLGGPHRDHVDVDAEETWLIGLADARDDRRAPITALRRIAIEAERLRHQLVEYFGDGLNVHRAAGGMPRESVAGQRGGDHGKRIARGTAVRDRGGEHRNDFHELVDRSRPSVQQQQRLGIGSAAFLANEMDLEAVDVSLEMFEAIQLRFMFAPIIFVAPIVEQLAHVREITPILPPSIRNLVWQAGASEPLLKIFEDTFGHIDSKRLNSIGHRT